MKRIFLALLFLLGLTLRAQTLVTICPDTNAGVVEWWPAIENITCEDETQLCDTTFLPGFFDLRAVATEGYRFDHWEVITTYSFYIDRDTVWCDTVVQCNTEWDEDSVESIYWDGWLDWDWGIPNLADPAILEDTPLGLEDIIRIEVKACFVAEAEEPDTLRPVDESPILYKGNTKIIKK